MVVVVVRSVVERTLEERRGEAGCCLSATTRVPSASLSLQVAGGELGGRGWPGLGGDHLVHHLVRVAPTERNLPTVQLPEEDAETVDITVGGGGLPSEELWGLHTT